MMSRKDSESCGLQMNWPHHLQLFGTKIVSKWRYWLYSFSSGSSQFVCFSIFATSHFAHDSCCNMEKPAEQRTDICDAYTCLLLSWNPECYALSFHFSHNHVHTTVGHVITLKWALRNLFHSRLGSPYHKVISCSVQCRNSTWCGENQDPWWYRQEMKWNTPFLRFRSQHVATVWPYLPSNPKWKSFPSSSSSNSIRRCPPSPLPSTEAL